MKVRILFPFLLLLTSCSDDKNIFNDVPYLRTTVTNINERGATFSATLLSGSSSSTDRGFLWTNAFPSYNSSEKKSLGTGDGGSSFSSDITFGLAKGNDYTVTAYMLVNSVMVYGEPTYFKSLGSIGPTITDFSPKKAKATELVTITGTGFSTVSYLNQISLNQTIFSSAMATENIIKFAVPTNLIGKTFNLSVSTPSGKATTATTFELDPTSPYQILSVNKNSVGVCEELQVTTTYIPAGTTINIFFNGVAATTISNDVNVSRVSTPPLPNSTTTIVLTMSIGSLQSSFSTFLNFLKPQIISFTGSLIAGSTVSVTAQNLPTCDVRSDINGSLIALKNYSSNHFEFVVPAGVGSSFNLNLGLNGNFRPLPFLTYNFR